MDRDAQLKYCSKCTLKKMDLKKGLLCTLTNDYADFEGTCPDFTKDYTEEKRVHGSLAPSNGLIVEEVHGKPEKYWKRLGYFLLLTLGLTLVNAGIYVWEINSSDVGNIPFYFAVTFFFIPVWAFIGWETDNLMHGWIAGGIGLVLAISNWLLPLPDWFFWGYIPFAVSAAYFAYMTLTNKRKLGLFIGISTIIFFGAGAMSYYGSLTLDEDLGQLLRLVFGMRNDLEHGFITWEIEAEDGWTSIRSFDWLFARLFSSVFVFLGITYLHKVLEGKQKWGFNLVSLGRNISQKNMGMYVLSFYAGIAFLSVGIFGVISYFFEWVWNPYWGNGGDMNDYIDIFFRASCGLFCLVFAVGLYRKILIEYYLERGQPISWNFYFGQIPIIGFFVWINNLATFKLDKNISLQKLKAISTRGNSLATFLLVMVILYALLVLLLAAGMGSRINPIAIGLVFLGLLIYINYLYTENGIYVFVGLHFTAFLIVLILQLFEVEIPEGLMSRGLFWSMAQAFLLYPCFHLVKFKIQLPIDENDEGHELVGEMDVIMD